MSEITIKFPPEFEKSVHLTKEELEGLIRLMAALKMFELGKISSGKAAELAGIPRVEFFEACSRYKVSLFNYTEEESTNEISGDIKAFENIESSSGNKGDDLPGK